MRSSDAALTTSQVIAGSITGKKGLSLEAPDACLDWTAQLPSADNIRPLSQTLEVCDILFVRWRQ
jgi:hypothetical protein